MTPIVLRVVRSGLLIINLSAMREDGDFLRGEKKIVSRKRGRCLYERYRKFESLLRDQIFNFLYIRIINV